MGMSNYNRQNPFMYLLESKQSELVNETTKSVKHMIEMIAISIIAILLNIIFTCIYPSYLWVISLIIAYLDFSSFLEIRSCIREIHAKDVNEMIFGDAYKDINVNNEMILSMINKYNVAIGKANHVNESTFIYIILYWGIIVSYVIVLLVTIFG